MKALVSYVYENLDKHASSPIGFDNDTAEFAGDDPTIIEIGHFELEHKRFPFRVNVRVISVVKLQEI